MSDSIVLDPDDLTLGEIEDIEEIAGVPVATLFSDPKALPAKALTAIVYVMKRRSDPEFTIERARATTIGSLDIGSRVDPPETAGSESWRSSAPSTA